MTSIDINGEPILILSKADASRLHVYLSRPFDVIHDEEWSKLCRKIREVADDDLEALMEKAAKKLLDKRV